MQWWFCLEHKVVEDSIGCPNVLRLGPYETRDLAGSAIERINARQVQFDEDEHEDN